jgi:hypothetical protein
MNKSAVFRDDIYILRWDDDKLIIELHLHSILSTIFGRLRVKPLR